MCDVGGRPMGRLFYWTLIVLAYTSKDFQLEVLDRLAEMQSLTESLEESCNT